MSIVSAVNYVELKKGCSAMYIKPLTEVILRYGYLTPQYLVLCWNEA